MTPRAKELLVRMASAYDQDRRTNFDSIFYMGVPGPVIDELEATGCITRQNDIIGTIELTQFGHKEAKK